MKRIICLLLAFMCMSIPSFSSTKPSFLQLKDSPIIDVRTFGARGDGITDDTTALQEAFASGGNIIMTGRYLYNGGDTSSTITVSSNTHIFGGGTIVIDSSGFTRSAIRMSMGGSDIALTIEDITIEGNDVCHYGIWCSTYGFTNNSLTVKNCKISDLSGATGALSAEVGVVAAGDWTRVAIEDCTISDIVRASGTTIGSNAAGGIEVSGGHPQIAIKNNIISNILGTSDNNWVDADGIRVLHVGNTSPETENILIQGNTLVNCSGRFVKLQTPNAVVSANTMTLSTGNVGTSFIFVDAQRGGITATENRLAISDSVVPSSPVKVFVVSEYSTVTYTKRNYDISHNEVSLGQVVNSVVYANLLASTTLEVSRHLSFCNNVVTGEGALTFIRVICEDTFSDAASTTLRIQNNDVEKGFDFVNLRGDYFLDYTRSLTYTTLVTGNTTRNSNVSDTILVAEPYSSNLGRFLVAKNTGWNRPWVRGEGAVLFESILPGTECYYTWGSVAGITNATGVLKTGCAIDAPTNTRASLYRLSGSAIVAADGYLEASGTIQWQNPY